MNRHISVFLISVSIIILSSCMNREFKHFLPAGEKNVTINEWENLKFGAFVHFNDNTCIEKEISRNTDPNVFNPEKLDFDSMLSVFTQAGVKYAVLTTRHTSGFCLWDSKTTMFDVANSPFRKDVVKLFVDACRRNGIKPCFYYCLWGNKDWDPTLWNPVIKAEVEGTSAKEIILAQLTELSENYGDIYEFWLDMHCWADTYLAPQELYDLLKVKNNDVIVHFNQHVQDGSRIKYFPTDILNGEERIPPSAGHDPLRTLDGKTYYLPFEYEITSQSHDSLSLGNGLMKGSVWFTYPGSRFYPVDSLLKYIRQSNERGGSNILLSTAPDKTGVYRQADRDSILKLGGLFSSGHAGNNSGRPLFRIAQSKDLEVTWRDKKLIAGDPASWIKDGKACSSAEVFEISKSGDWKYSNCWSSRSILPYRREAAISGDGKRIEISFQAHMDAMMETYPAKMISYKILVPLATLNNSTWDAFTGRSYNAKWTSGQLGSSTPDGDLVGVPARWISFSTADGMITFDFNPHGLPTYYVSGFNTIQSQWVIEKKGDFLEFSFGTPPTNFGGALTSKVAIFEGGKDDYLKHHAVSYYHYFSEIPAEKLFCFSRKSSTAFTYAGTGRYDKTKGFGWRNTKNLDESGDGINGALHSAVSSSVKNTYVTDNLRPGLYLITLRSSAIGRNIGSFKVTLNKEIIFNDIKVEKGNTATLTCVRWIEGGSADIGFSGDWAVSVIGFQLFLHRDEDFVFRRGFWIKNDGFCPDIMLSNYFNTPPVLGKSVTFSRLAGKTDDIKDIPQFPELETALPDQKSKGLLWRYTSPLGTLGPDNYGSFNEFNTEEKIKKRLEQIRKGGVEAVILNGFLSRHTFPVHLKRVEENIREIVEEGHKTGMKFLDHQDLTILWNMDMGFRFLAAHPEYLQHSITNGLPTWGICPVNPLFNKDYFFPYITDFIKNTGIDGLMIDECTFHGSNFCNCDFCRKDFTESTGLILPDDETSSLLQNRNSGLWKAWIEWRKNTIAKWRIDLSKISRELNPDFCNIQYYSEGGFMTDYASYGQGGDLALSARSMDFLGTEIMSRDVWDDYRYNFSSRHMYNSLRETFNSPVFGLVYPAGKVSSAIIGWAMNTMLAQVTWSLGGENEFKIMDNYTGWKENMNNLSAIPAVDAALIFSRKTRDWSVRNKDSYSEELMGTSQFLSSKQIQHTFILDDALLNQDLSRFPVLLAPGLECISDEQAGKLRNYVRSGGTLFLTGEACRFSSYGEPRSTWIFEDIISENQLKNTSDTSLAESFYGKGRIIYSPGRYGLNEFCGSSTLGDSYRFNPDQEITALNEKIFNRIFKSGLSFKSVSIPSKVLVSVYRDNVNEKKIKLVHILNASGVKIKNGDKLPDPDPEWGKIRGDMIFEISIPSVSDSYYSTPDTPGHKSVGVEQISEGRYRITVPEGTVDKYGIIYLYQ